MNVTFYASIIMMTMADVLKVQDEIVSLMDRLAHKENPCKMGTSSYDNEMCNLFTGYLSCVMSRLWPWLSYMIESTQVVFSPVILGVAAVERQMGVDDNRLVLGRPYSFKNS